MKLFEDMEEMGGTINDAIQKMVNDMFREELDEDEIAEIVNGLSLSDLLELDVAYTNGDREKVSKILGPLPQLEYSMGAGRNATSAASERPAPRAAGGQQPSKKPGTQNTTQTNRNYSGGVQNGVTTKNVDNGDPEQVDGEEEQIEESTQSWPKDEVIAKISSEASNYHSIKTSNDERYALAVLHDIARQRLPDPVTERDIKTLMMDTAEVPELRHIDSSHVLAALEKPLEESVPQAFHVGDEVIDDQGRTGVVTGKPFMNNIHVNFYNYGEEAINMSKLEINDYAGSEEEDSDLRDMYGDDYDIDYELANNDLEESESTNQNKKYFAAVARQLGVQLGQKGRLTSYYEDHNSRNIEMMIGDMPVILSHYWGRDGTSNKPVTTVELDYEDQISYGRWAIWWAKPDEYAEDLAGPIKEHYAELEAGDDPEDDDMYEAGVGAPDYNPARGEYNTDAGEDWNSQEVIRALETIADEDPDEDPMFAAGLKMLATRIYQSYPDYVSMSDINDMLREPDLRGINFEDVKYALQASGIMEAAPVEEGDKLDKSGAESIIRDMADRYQAAMAGMSDEDEWEILANAEELAKKYGVDLDMYFESRFENKEAQVVRMQEWIKRRAGIS